MARILIVDDEAPLRKLYSTILSKEGHEVLEAATATSGFDLAVAEHPDLILLDVMMPVADGVDLFSRLAAHPGTRRLRVIFLTSLVQEEEVIQGRGVIGGRAYISKSTPVPRFVALIAKALTGAAPAAS